MESEVTCSLPSDISLQDSQLKQSTQDYTNRSAWLRCASPVFKNKISAQSLSSTLSIKAVGGFFFQKATHWGGVFLYCVKWKEHFSVWNISPAPSKLDSISIGCSFTSQAVSMNSQPQSDHWPLPLRRKKKPSKAREYRVQKRGRVFQLTSLIKLFGRVSQSHWRNLWMI